MVLYKILLQKAITKIYFFKKMLRNVLTRENKSCIIILRNVIKMIGGAKMNKRKYRELNELKGKITESKETYRSLSEKTGISLNTLNNKINGYSAFNVDEVSEVCRVLNIQAADIPRYFFA